MSKISDLAESELAAFRQHQALVSLHLGKAETHLERFLAIVNHADGGALPAALSNVKCVRVWTEWLRENGPALKSTITDATGVKFTEHGTPFTIKWFDYLADRDNSNVSPDTIVRFSGYRSDGRGASPAIYALWSQRYDVRDQFGVGPERPDETVLGVIQPEEVERPDPTIVVRGWVEPENPITWDDILPDEESPPPYNVMDWQLQHADILAIARQGLKPNPEQFALLRSTHPDGADGANLAVALAARGSVQEFD